MEVPTEAEKAESIESIEILEILDLTDHSTLLMNTGPCEAVLLAAEAEEEVEEA